MANEWPRYNTPTRTLRCITSVKGFKVAKFEITDSNVRKRPFPLACPTNGIVSLRIPSMLFRPALSFSPCLCWSRAAGLAWSVAKLRKKWQIQLIFPKNFEKSCIYGKIMLTLQRNLERFGIEARLTITVPAVHTIRTAGGSFHEIWPTKHREPYRSKLNCLRIAGCSSATGLSQRNASSVSVTSVWKPIGGICRVTPLIMSLRMEVVLRMWLSGMNSTMPCERYYSQRLTQ